MEVRFVMRMIGTAAGSITPEDFAEYLEYNFFSKGFKLWKQYETPVYGGQDGKEVVAVKYWMTLVKE